MVSVFGSAKLDRTDPGKQVLYDFILCNRCRQNTAGIDFVPFLTQDTRFGQDRTSRSIVSFNHVMKAKREAILDCFPL